MLSQPSFLSHFLEIYLLNRCFFEQTDSFLSSLWEIFIQEEIAEKVKPEESWMKIQGPIPHWNNFTVPELKDILKHCIALERLGIAQDEEMMVSIKRDIALREKKISERYIHYESKPTKTKQQINQNHSKTNRIIRRTAHPTKQQPQDYLLEQTA